MEDIVYQQIRILDRKIDNDIKLMDNGFNDRVLDFHSVYKAYLLKYLEDGKDSGLRNRLTVSIDALNKAMEKNDDVDVNLYDYEILLCEEFIDELV